MLRKFAIVLAGAAALALSACGGSAPTLTFAQQVGIACGAANGEIVILESDGVFTGGAANTLEKDVKPAIAKVCAAGASATTPDLKTLVNTTLPLVKTFVDASSLPQDKKNAADAAIDSGVIAFNIAISMAPATSSTAASAPAAASTPLAGAALQ